MGNVKNKAEQLRTLKIGNGIQYLLNEAYKIFGNPVLLQDMEYNMIACTENIVTDDPFWSEFTTAGKISRELIELCKNENFHDAVANAPKITFMISEKIKYNRLFGKIFNGDNILIGGAILVALEPFTDDIPELFECFCDIVNKELAESEYYRNYGQEYQEIIINKLIAGNVEDKEIYAAHVESIYMNLKDYLYLAVIDASQCDPAYAKLPDLRDSFRLTRPDFKYSIYDNYIVIIMNFDNAPLEVIKDLPKLNRLFRQNNMYAGVSSCFDNLFELRKYYLEAVEALNNGIKSGGSLRIFTYGEALQ